VPLVRLALVSGAVSLYFYVAANVVFVVLLLTMAVVLDWRERRR
jgi:hypothetical protein